jgi:acyl transferase domain-containing protein/acyl carrier protein
MFAGLVSPHTAEKKYPLANQANQMPIALIGIGCRFSGANGPQAFWELLRDGVDAVGEFPANRFEMDSVYDSRPGTPGKISNRQGGFIESIEDFDASFFGISPREALKLDPQQRLLLEVTWEALEDAGIPPHRLAGTNTGVFIGACTTDYEDIQYYLRERSEIDLYVATGTARSILSGRISYTFDFAGPSLTVDTACSSSLVAVHLACQSLWSGESSLAISGGVNLVLLPELSMPFSRASMLATDGRCKFADVQANGFTRSDGAAVVLLKPLAQAQADGDPIYAVILGSAINNDGRSSGLLATPSRYGQEAVLRQAYRKAGVCPGTVGYVEVHGTGTSVGDPVEINSLGAVLAEGRPANSPCLLGSVKTNIGHTEGAAGIAGLIKTALCLKNKAIPPSLHFNEPNPAIAWHQLPLQVSRQLTTWPTSSTPAIAGVSAFGLSATNAHVVMQETPVASTSGVEDGTDKGAQLLALSAHTPQALEDMAKAYLTFCETTDSRLTDICYSAGVRRAHHEYRLAAVASSRQEMCQQLQTFLDKENNPNLANGHYSAFDKRKLAFVFPGQGAQWLGMGRQLMQQEPVFKMALESCDEVFRLYVNWSLIEELTADNSNSRLNEIDIVQPCLFAIQVALAKLWRHWGIEPDVVIGQSMGEVAAAHVAGSLSLEDAAQIICRRSLLLKRLSGQGGMAVVGLSFEETQEFLFDYRQHLSVAVSSSPNTTVISGDSEALMEAMASLQQKNIFCQSIKVDVASHSPQMDVLREDLLEALAGINPQIPSTAFCSTVTGVEMSESLLDAQYWVNNLRQPVLFSRAIQNLLESGCDMFLEVSPHPLLAAPIQQTSRQLAQEITVLSSLRSQEDERALMLGSAAVLYAAGYPLDWNKLFSPSAQYVPLPTYCWQKQTFWLGPEQTSNNRRISNSDHILSGQMFASAADPQTCIWEFDLGSEAFPFLKDHCVQGTVVIPAAAYLEMAMVAGRSLYPEANLLLEQVEFKQALVLEKEPRCIQLVISSRNSERAKFEFFSRQPDTEPHSWMLHATGTLRVVSIEQAPLYSTTEAIFSRSNQLLSQTQYYDWLSQMGLEYGACFQGVQQLWQGDKEALGVVTLPEALDEKIGSYYIHPAFLDSCFQVLAAALPNSHRQPHLPVGLESLQIYKRMKTNAKAYASLRKSTGKRDEVLKGDLVVFDEEGEILLEVKGMRMKPLTQNAQGLDDTKRLEQLLYNIQWQVTEPLKAHNLTQKNSGTWIIFADNGGTAQKLVKRLESIGDDCIIVSTSEHYAQIGSKHYQIQAQSRADYEQLFDACFQSGLQTCRGIVHLWSLDIPMTANLPKELPETFHEMGWGSTLLLVQTLAAQHLTKAPRLWLVTSEQQFITGEESLSVAQSPLWGLGSVIAQEYADLRCSLIDLGSRDDSEMNLLGDELLADNDAEQIALRGKVRYEPRLLHHNLSESTAHEKETVSEGQAFQLEVTTKGILDSLILRQTVRQKPAQGELEIEVQAVGLNFRDVMLSMGVLPSAPDVKEDFGWECSGKVVAVGEGVEGFSIGDQVYGIAHPCFGAYAKMLACLTLHKPQHLSFEQAATIPLTLLTAYYSLHHIGRLQAGERLLIHCATGGVGLAAIRIAQQQGAEIFATAGNQQKRDYLKSLGIQHIFDSRSLNYVEEIKQATNGVGLDMILNSLAGEAIPAGLSLLRTGGRFIELGRRDIYQNAKLGLEPFQNNLAFFAVDLASLIRQNPHHMGFLLRQAICCFEQQGGSPYPLQTFSIAEAADGFRTMAQASHIGKIALRVGGEKVKVMPALMQDMKLNSNGTYLITGGLGGLGLTVAQRMIERGAQHLVLLSRSAGSATAQEAVEAMRKTANVRVVTADISNHQEIAQTLAYIKQQLPPLKGVVHAAGLLDDGILLQQQRSRFLKVMAPKIAGAWNLHTLTLDVSLDFFVLFSSAATLLGSAGQGNYTAANAFLDSLAQYRKSQGLPAISIAWGPWAEVGLAAEGNRGERLAQKGINSMKPVEGVTVFEHLLNASTAQIAVVDVNVEQWSHGLENSRRAAFFSEITSAHNHNQPVNKVFEASLTREALLSAAEPERKELLQEYLNRLLTRVLGFGKLGIHRLDIDQPVNRFGLDSLMALEVKTRLEADLGITIPILHILKGTSIRRLIAYALEQLPNSTPLTKHQLSNPAAIAGLQWEEFSL